MSSAYMPNTRIIAQLPRHFTSVCTIHKYSVTYGTNREPRGVYTPATIGTRLYRIPCRVAPMFLVRPQSVEVVAPTGISENTQRTCMLKGLYPEIALEDKAEVDGLVYEVVSAEPDGSFVYTRLGLLLKGT